MTCSCLPATESPDLIASPDLSRRPVLITALLVLAATLLVLAAGCGPEGQVAPAEFQNPCLSVAASNDGRCRPLLLNRSVAPRPQVLASHGRHRTQPGSAAAMRSTPSFKTRQEIRQ